MAEEKHEGGEGQEQGAGTEPAGTDPNAEPKEPEGGNPGEGQEGGKEGDAGLLDKHGMPGINRDKYNRDMAAKDKEIEALKAELKTKSETEEGRKELEGKIEGLEQKLIDERISFELQLAGCRNEKAAKALLGDHEGKVDKLKAAEPWLFDDGNKGGSTGMKPGGAPNDYEKRLQHARDAVKGKIYG